MRSISVSAAARGKLSALVNAARGGELTLITRKGEDAAYLVPADLVKAAASKYITVSAPACRSLRALLAEERR